MQKKDFFLCGFTGWCLEILWTGLHSLVTGHFTMMGKTSLLMFPVYGLAALIRPAYYKLARFPVMVRGIIYSCGIFFVEFLSGSFFQKLHICPWDYSHVPLQYKGVIRLDYAPLWFFTGGFLPVSFSNGFFDKILGKSLENLTVILYDNWKESYFQ